MNYYFFNTAIDREDLIFPDSDKINSFLLKNNKAEIVKAVDFLASEDKFLHVHGFMGTGKRQFINYLGDFFDKEVIKLEYYCKESTVCDDILLNFNEYIDNLSISKVIGINTKITTLNARFFDNISSIKKPFIIILHSLDCVLEHNRSFITECFKKILREDNVKLIISTRGMQPDILGDLDANKKVFLKAFTKEIFNEFVENGKIKATEQVLADFYKYTRGYYYYTALSIKIVQAMNIDLAEFLYKYNQSGLNFDSFLGVTYVNLVPTSVRNYFWFLRTIRHGLSLNALAEFEVYDEYSLEYLKNNLMIFQEDEMVYVQDFFVQKIDISIPQKTEIKLHKYIIGIYEKQLKMHLKDRAIFISRQAMRSEIEYHNHCIAELQNEVKPVALPVENLQQQQVESTDKDVTVQELLNQSKEFAKDKKYTDAIQILVQILELENLDITTITEVRLHLAKLYKDIEEFAKSRHYYEIVELYYMEHKEVINLNYLYYDLADLYFKMYKQDRAIETLKKVIYSVDTPQSLLVDSCLMLGNIYSEIDNADEAYVYYKKALDSVGPDAEDSLLAELYFKFALANDDKGVMNLAFEYYNKCISISSHNLYKASAYSNLASCYYENGNASDALNCFKTAFEIEKAANNYEGIYYTTSNIGKILTEESSESALEYLLEAKSSAEFINVQYYILQAGIALGDFYYNYNETRKKCLIEYFKAFKLANVLKENVDIRKIEQRIDDMKFRMSEEEFKEIENKYGKRN